MLHVSSDRRICRRVPIDVLANRFLDGYPYLCRATDISPQGMRLTRFNEPTSRSRFVGLQFQLPGSEEIITASGEIVSAVESERALGIRFTHLTPNAAAAIDRYVRHVRDLGRVSVSGAAASSGQAAG